MVLVNFTGLNQTYKSDRVLVLRCKLLWLKRSRKNIILFFVSVLSDLFPFLSRRLAQSHGYNHPGTYPPLPPGAPIPAAGASLHVYDTTQCVNVPTCSQHVHVHDYELFA